VREHIAGQTVIKLAMSDAHPTGQELKLQASLRPMASSNAKPSPSIPPKASITPASAAYRSKSIAT